jgi:hypothetical protein
VGSSPSRALAGSHGPDLACPLPSQHSGPGLVNTLLVCMLHLAPCLGKPTPLVFLSSGLLLYDLVPMTGLLNAGEASSSQVSTNSNVVCCFLPCVIVWDQGKWQCDSVTGKGCGQVYVVPTTELCCDSFSSLHCESSRPEPGLHHSF